MTAPQLTDEQRRQVERIGKCATWAVRASGLLVFALLLAAIWAGDWRFAATAALMLLVGGFAVAVGAQVRRALAKGNA